MAKDVVKVTVGEYTVLCCSDRLPDNYAHYRAHAALVEESDLEPPSDYRWCVAVQAPNAAGPRLLVAQGCRLRWEGEPINPGVLLVPETGRLFLGMQERLVTYDLHSLRRLWSEQAEYGFSGWSRHGDVVLMAAEIEFAAWDLRGQRLWPTFVEPPWDYRVADATVHLTVLDVGASFPLATGPGWGAQLPWHM